MTQCCGCGALFPTIEGPTHRYMASSPACWAAFGEVLAHEYSDSSYQDIHRLTVDAYAVQHPGQPSTPTINSIGVHLVRLCLLLEKGLDMSRANDAMLTISKNKAQFVWLTPPASMGQITVAHLQSVQCIQQHKNRVREWAQSAWEAWAQHHDVVRLWLPDIE